MLNVLYMLLGATFVAIGVLASALADRIRSSRSARVVDPREHGHRSMPSSTHRTPSSTSSARSDLVRPKSPRAPRIESKPGASTDGGDDVIAALVAAGYKKPLATEAAWACSGGERATIEGWTAAALRRCARGGLA